MGQGMEGGLDLLIKAAKGIVVHAPSSDIKVYRYMQRQSRTIVAHVGI